MAPNRKSAPRADAADAIFSLESLKEFMRFFEKVEIAQVEVKVRDKSLILSKQAAAPAHPVYQVPQAAPAPVAPAAPAVAASAPAAPKPAAPSNLVEIASPIVGTFYRSSEPGAASFVNVGDTIAPGKVVCIIEAMKIFNEIKAEVGGVVREICVENEQPVEYGQVLFRIEKK